MHTATDERNGCCFKLHCAITNLSNRYVFFNYRVLFILALASAGSLVENALVAVLITHLTDAWGHQNLKRSVILVNMQDGLSSLFVIILAHIADCHLQRFTTITISTLAYISSLIVLLLASRYDNMGVAIVALILLSVGISGKPILKNLLADLLRGLNVSSRKDEERLQAQTTFCWRISCLCGATVGALVVSPLSWETICKVSTIAMASAFVIFVSGYNFYFPNELTTSPCSILFKVLMAATRNRNLPLSDETEKYDVESIGDPPVLPNTSKLRCLNKAAIVRSPPNVELHCTREQVEEVKLLLLMAPMWSVFLLYCLVLQLGTTFFWEQSWNLDDHISIGTITAVPIAIFNIIMNVSSFGVSYVFELLIPKNWSEQKKSLATKLQIFLGMLFSCLSCFAAWKLEVHRLEKVRNLYDYETEVTNISIFWLTPQFCLYGFMRGLAENGLLVFYNSQVGEAMAAYGFAFNEFVLGIGKFISMFSILIFGSWFGDHINLSHVDRYYLTVACIMIGNHCFCIWLITYAYKDAQPERRPDDEEDPNDDDELQEFNTTPQSPPSGSLADPPEELHAYANMSSEEFTPDFDYQFFDCL